MDLNLVTGKPGASKTLNTIKDVEKRRIDEGRPVYYHGINDLTLPWVKMDDSEKLEEDPDAITPHSWWQAPPGSIIVIDEAQDHFPSASLTSKAPEYIAKFGQFRHLGFSMYLITQGPLLVNPRFKAWVQPHIHYKRLWGGFFVVKFINESMITETNSTKISETAIKKIIKIDKSVFGLYKSAEMHTRNTRVNKKMWLMLLIPMILVPFLFSLSFKTFRNQLGTTEQDPEISDTEIVHEVQSSPSDGFSLMPSHDVVRFNPMTDFVPRVAAMPETSPAYDDLRKPKDFPRPQCVLHPKSGGCNCYTQQATLMHDYPHDLCVTYVKHGYFDATKARKEVNFEHNRQKDEKITQPVVHDAMSDYSSALPIYMRSDGVASVPDAFRSDI